MYHAVLEIMYCVPFMMMVVATVTQCYTVLVTSHHYTILNWYLPHPLMCDRPFLVLIKFGNVT